MARGARPRPFGVVPLFFASPPTDRRVRALLDERAEAPFTYEPVGVTEAGLERAPRGFHLDRYGTVIARTRDGAEQRALFDAAVERLKALENYPPSFTHVVLDERPFAPGKCFATVARHLGFASVHPCRLIYVIDEPGRFGFGFGTLPGHEEAGEERFLLTQDGDDLRYDVLAFSRPRGLLTRLGAPIARAYQRRFQRETLAHMRAASVPRV